MKGVGMNKDETGARQAGGQKPSGQETIRVKKPSGLFGGSISAETGSNASMK
ncbi:hypothetical protein [Xanthobacter autotrophicus]|uniref:hypothetical protein n=1 Tax=Xanthobacter autotrophicus TaxID=280 RepID=UPI00372717CF